MIGAIAGDIVGYFYAGHSPKKADLPMFGPWCHFTNDTALTEAVADAIAMIPIPVLEFWHPKGIEFTLLKT